MKSSHYCAWCLVVAIEGGVCNGNLGATQDSGHPATDWPACFHGGLGMIRKTPLALVKHVSGAFKRRNVRMAVAEHKFNLCKCMDCDEVLAPAPNQNTASFAISEWEVGGRPTEHTNPRFLTPARMPT